MSIQDYEKAYKLGKKEYQRRLMDGKRPTLKVLDEILPVRGSYSEVPLGLVQIPLDQIVGTKSDSRSNAFARNFMPILKEGSEFAYKWAALCDSQIAEGIRDPIKAYEYMNKFYVEEGNKRVSVLKYFQLNMIPGIVTRIIPKPSDELENKIYYEFLDFYEATKINYIWFSELGSFTELQEVVGKEPGEVWTEDECMEFRSLYTKFEMEYKDSISKNLSVIGDAFLKFIKIHGYEESCQLSVAELKELMHKTKEEFELLKIEDDIDIKMDPTEEKMSIFSQLITKTTKKFKIAFIYEKTIASSAWTYSHELGRLHLEEVFSDDVTTMYYENVTKENVADVIDEAVAEGCNLIFTTTPAFTQVSVKKAIEYPSVRIMNCSLNTSHRYIRTYYTRLHEAKFLMGAIAGSMAKNNKILYVADYPIYGTIAQINAFAIGAQMINPHVQIHLEWSSKKDFDLDEVIEKVQPDCISGKDMRALESETYLYGISKLEDGIARNLAMPLMNWGVFYEKLVKQIMDGTWKMDEDSAEHKAINYWWGMSADVVDVICSRKLPLGTKRLVSVLKESICNGSFTVFEGELYSQEGVVQPDPEVRLKPEEVASIDWLADNIIGEIPETEGLTESAIPVVAQQGVKKKG